MAATREAAQRVDATVSILRQVQVNALSVLVFLCIMRFRALTTLLQRLDLAANVLNCTLPANMPSLAS